MFECVCLGCVYIHKSTSILTPHTYLHSCILKNTELGRTLGQYADFPASAERTSVHTSLPLFLLTAKLPGSAGLFYISSSVVLEFILKLSRLQTRKLRRLTHRVVHCLKSLKHLFHGPLWKLLKTAPSHPPAEGPRETELSLRPLSGRR